MEIILGILSKKINIQKVAKEKGIAPTLISLWKKQALDAMAARFQPQPKGRRKTKVEVVASSDTGLKSARNEARAAKIKASHLENSLREAREKLGQLEEQLKGLAATMGCELTKARKHRAARKPHKA